MFCDCYQVGVEEGSASTFAVGIKQYGWACTTTTTGTSATVKILTDSWGGKHQALPNLMPVHSIQYLANGQIRGLNNVCYCDGSVRGSIVQYTPGSSNPIIFTDTGLVPSVKP
jgi:prepilin-type processing-associated H-X9-DG protein